MSSVSQLFIRTDQPLNQTFTAENVPPATMDVLWSHGWRHFGTRFYRYNLSMMGGALQKIIALRLGLGHVQLSKSQRRNLRRNADLHTVIQPVEIDEAKLLMFEKHRHRFDEYIPDSLYNFLSEKSTSTVPCQCNEVSIYDGSGRLLAVSFLDTGVSSISSVFAMFDPDYADRGLGTYTLLQEFEYGQQTNRQWHYPGYSTLGSSRYDYKKRFHGLHSYDFATFWKPFPRLTA